MNEGMQGTMSLGALLRADMKRLEVGGAHVPAMIACLFLKPGFLTVFLYRLSAACQSKGLLGRIAAKILWRLNVLLSSCDISPRAVIGPGLHLPHPMGIVIGDATVGQHVRILQNVALGLKNFTEANRYTAADYPIIHDNATLCAGAIITGPVTVGEGAIVGANAVVLHNVPANAVAVGVPARIIENKAKPASF